ncbi:MAG: peptidoglycan-binding protein [Oscillatoriales cyanobacterium]|nr:MAG: peptidoglycan-binding protein [Oscillatoriales cyanobacterium]
MTTDRPCQPQSLLILLVTAIGWGIFSPIAPALAQPCNRPDRPDLSPGDNGNDVRRLQSILLLLGFYQGPIDGSYSTDLANAVQSFQEATSLDPSGQVNTETWNKLLPNSACPNRPPDR